MIRHFPDYTLHFITDESLSAGRSSVTAAERALKGGASVIQLRDKGREKDFLLHTGRALKELCRHYNALFIVNDAVDIALELSADGIHLGQSDTGILEARAMLGERIIIGISVTTIDEALEAEQNGADYLGAGPVFPTSSKDDAEQSIHLRGLEDITARVRIPVVAIGGISSSNASSVKNAGASGIAVISALSRADDIETETRLLLNAFNN